MPTLRYEPGSDHDPLVEGATPTSEDISIARRHSDDGDGEYWLTLCEMYPDWDSSDAYADDSQQYI